jgi:hypothetical protein
VIKEILRHQEEGDLGDPEKLIAFEKMDNLVCDLRAKKICACIKKAPE